MLHSTLTNLNVGRNRLHGPIPSELGLLSLLESLIVVSSGQSGPIPIELGALVFLQELDLSFNRLTGPIPSQLGSMTSMVEMKLNNNLLAGLIPSELGSLSSLSRLDLRANNGLQSLIPAELQLACETHATCFFPGGQGQPRPTGPPTNQTPPPAPAPTSPIKFDPVGSIDCNCVQRPQRGSN